MLTTRALLTSTASWSPSSPSSRPDSTCQAKRPVQWFSSGSSSAQHGHSDLQSQVSMNWPESVPDKRLGAALAAGLVEAAELAGGGVERDHAAGVAVVGERVVRARVARPDEDAVQHPVV